MFNEVDEILSSMNSKHLQKNHFLLSNIKVDSRYMKLTGDEKQIIMKHAFRLWNQTAKSSIGWREIFFKFPDFFRECAILKLNKDDLNVQYHSMRGEIQGKEFGF